MPPAGLGQSPGQRLGTNCRVRALRLHDYRSGHLARRGAGPLVSVGFIVAEWAVGLGAIVLLWRRETTAYIGPG